MKFIRIKSGNTLINTAQIASINLEEPKFEAKDYRVVAYIPLNGSYVLFSGTKKVCEAFMTRIELESQR